MVAPVLNKTVPGVYIQELAGVRPITGASTGVCGFVGISAKADPQYTNVPTLVTGWNDFVSKYGSFQFGTWLAYGVYQFFAQGGTTCYVVQLAPPPDAGIASSADVAWLGTLAVASSGTWGNKLQVSVTNTPASAGGTTTGFTLNVEYLVPVVPAAGADYDFWGTLLQQQAKVNGIKPNVVAIKKVDYYLYTLESISGLIVQDQSSFASAQARINSSSLYLRLTDPPKAFGPRSNTGDKPAAFKGGSDGSWVFYDGTAPAKGVPALGSLQDNVVNFIAMPDLVRQSPKDQLTQINLTLGFVDGQSLVPPRDTGFQFLIADPPLGLQADQILAFKNGETIKGIAASGGNTLNTQWAALYYPWIAIFDSVAQQNVLVPPSGIVAGTYAHTDATRGVFKAPGGISDGHLGIATGMETSVTESQQSVLNPNGINAIRDIPNFGICIWGVRTLDLDPAMMYINVRRTMIYLEQSIKAGTWWAVFEPNDQTLWGKINRNVSAFLKQFWLAGGLFGKTAEEAFYVKVDADNNPPEQRDLGYLVVEIGVSIVKPAEFIILQFTQQTKQSS